jgi:choline dehydrogenase-like flavoprotein
MVVERLVELLCPVGPDAPAERRATLDRLVAYRARLPRSTRAGLAAALVALDQVARLYPPSRGRRFSSLDAAVAERYLGLLLRGRVGPARQAAELLAALVTLCHYDVPAVRARLGYEPDAHIARVAARRLERHGEAIRRAEAAVVEGAAPEPPPGARPPGIVDGEGAGGDLELACDVVVVGSGAGGATMAAELADSGIDVVVLEEGGYHPTESFGTDVVRALGTLYRSGGAQTMLGSPPVTFLEGRCVGGSTVVNGGMCWRTPPAVLERWSRSEGIAAISPADMERHFDRVEARLSVGPQEPESIGRDAEALRRGAQHLGWELTRSARNQLHCGGCDSCFCGCPTGAKRSMLVTGVRRALARGARLVPGCRVQRITRAGGVTTGVEGRLVRGGARVTVRAPVVVAACGAIQTPALLARSGLRSRSGQLGRNLTVHPSAALVAIFDHEVRGWQGVHQAYQVTEFLRDGILVTASTLPPALVASSLPLHGAALAELMRDYNRMVVAGCLVEDSATGRVVMLPGGRPVIRYQLTDADARRMVRGLSHAAEIMLAAGARRLMVSVEGVREPLEPDAARRLLRGTIRPSALRPFTVHAMGTARMSPEPGRGVVAGFGELHGAPGVVVADASILPGPVGVNPMETIVALATRNAERLVERRAQHGI